MNDKLHANSSTISDGGFLTLETKPSSCFCIAHSAKF